MNLIDMGERFHIANESDPSLQQWFVRQEAARVLCSLCGLLLETKSHPVDILKPGSFICGRACLPLSS